MNRRRGIDVNIEHELPSNATRKEVVQSLNKTGTELLESYLPEAEIAALNDVEKTFKSLLTLPDSIWNLSSQLPNNDPKIVRWLNGTRDLAQTVFNSIPSSFSLAAPAEKLDVIDVQSATEAAYLAAACKCGTVVSSTSSLRVSSANLSFKFIYTLITAGLVLILTTVLHLVCKQRWWSAFNILQATVTVSIDIRLTLINFTHILPKCSLWLLTNTMAIANDCYLSFCYSGYCHMYEPKQPLFRRKVVSYSILKRSNNMKLRTV